MWLLTITLLCAQAFASMSCPPFIEVDGTELSIPLSPHDSFATPDCKSLGLSATSDLKCDDGKWIIYNPEADEKYPLKDRPFPICLDLADYGMEEDRYEGNVDHLRKFWETVKASFPEANNCPKEAMECYTFDVFGERYERDGGILDSFIDLIPLDIASELQYLATVGQYVREFVFYEGLIGRVIELDSGESFTTLNTADVEDFQLFIRPVMLEDESWNYVIYREDTTEEVKTATPDHDHSERRKLTRQDATDVEFFQERLLQAPEHQRRMLQNTDVVSITFMYDPTIQLSSEAKALATSIVIDLNNALGYGFEYQVVLKGVVLVTEFGVMNPGKETAVCANHGGVILHNVCRQQYQSLPDVYKGDLYHCFAANDVYKGGVVGCASGGSAGVTEIGHSHSTMTGVHEVGHQLFLDHDKSKCWCAKDNWVWSWSAWDWVKDGCEKELCTIMHTHTKSKTGHPLVNIFTEEEKAQVLDVSPMLAERQADSLTWEHCANEHGTCQCRGTVRYGAIGYDANWASVEKGICVAANKRYVVVNGQWEFTGTVDSCKKLCEKHYKCLGISFIPNYKHCHLNVEIGESLPLHDNSIRWGNMIYDPVLAAIASENSWSCFKANRPGSGKWSSPRPVRGQIKCSNDVFGDPYRGMGKICECAADFRV